MFYCPEHAPKRKGASKHVKTPGKKAAEAVTTSACAIASPSPQVKTPGVRDTSKDKRVANSVEEALRTPPPALVRQASRNSKRVTQAEPLASVSATDVEARQLLAPAPAASNSSSLAGVRLSLSGLDTECKVRLRTG
eukprot:scaffold7204_cov354-Prasinococcus_capsulatus_cf.AAC.9